MKILLVNEHDFRGGAAKIAHNLHRYYLSARHSSWFAVAYKSKKDDRVVQIPDLPPVNGVWASLLWRLREPWKNRIGKRGTGVAMRALRALANPRGEIERRKGHEDFNYPGSKKLLEIIPEKPDIIHLHNLHKNYFDLRYLHDLSKNFPVLFTMHDEWLLTGHCACTMGCKRWKIGCGQCPDLTIYPSILKDATNFNWQRKKEIYRQCRFFVAAPSQWLMDKVKESILAPAIVEARVIPNGVDQHIFKPGAKADIRSELKLPVDAKIILLILARNFKNNKFKDFKTIKDALSIIMKGKTGKNNIAIGIGSDDADEHFNSQHVKIVGFIKDEKQLAKYYQASDVFIHAAHSDNFPTTILESLACGTPVVATAVGGIPEQIADGESGFLVPARDPQAMAHSVMKMLLDEELLNRMSVKAAEIAQERYDSIGMVNRYLEWYQEIIGNRSKKRI